MHPTQMLVTFTNRLTIYDIQFNHMWVLLRLALNIQQADERIRRLESSRFVLAFNKSLGLVFDYRPVVISRAHGPLAQLVRALDS